MKRFFRILLLVILIGVFLYSAYMLLDYFLESRKQTEAYDSLAQIVEAARQDMETHDSEAPAVEGTDDSRPAPKLVTVTDPDTGEEISILAEYAELYLKNSDFAGWIQIPDTKINYPIMHAPEHKDYYLHVNFNDEYSNHGSLYAREECDFQKPSDNVTIYGHNMKDGTMFAALMKYEDRKFWETHQTIFLDTLTQRYQYQVIAVFTTTASVGQGFEYHMFVDAADEAEFDQFVSTCKKLALYDTGETAVYGDKLITLSTCEYSQTNGRLVVVAKRVAQETGIF